MRGSVSLPALAKQTGWTLIGAAAVFSPIMVGSLYWQRQMLLIALWSMPALAVMVLVGFSGELFIGQLAIFAVGAFASAQLTETTGWPFFGAVLASTVIAGLAGVVLAAPALRLGAWRLAITSLFMVYVVPDVINADPWHLTGGATGLPSVTSASLFGHQLGTEGLELFTAASTAVVVLVVRNLRVSSWGGCLALVRGSHPAAESVGISIFHTRLVVYTISALIAGYAGAVFPHIDQYLGPGSFPLSQAILLLAGPIIGGMAALSGAIAGTALLLLVPLVFVSFVNYSLIIYGAVLIVVTIVLPSGIIPALAGIAGRASKTLRPPQGTGVGNEPAGPAAPSLAAVEQRAPIEVESVSKGFGGLLALDSVSLVAAPGEITAVIGPNGSGKTTLLNVLTAFYRPSAGTVRLAGRDLAGRKPYQVARLGVARTFQVAHLPQTQTAREIVTTGRFHHESASLLSALFRLPSARRSERRNSAHAEGFLSLVGMGDVVDRLGSELTVGQQRLVELARAIATGSPVLLLDEPAAGLVGEEVDHLAHLLTHLKALGYTIVLVDHHMELVMRVATKVAVLNFGTLIATGTPDEVRSAPEVVAAYLGTARAVTTNQSPNSEQPLPTDSTAR